MSRTHRAGARRVAAVLTMALTAVMLVPQGASAAGGRQAQAPPFAAVDFPAGYRIVHHNGRGQALVTTPEGYVLWDRGGTETPVPPPPGPGETPAQTSGLWDWSGVVGLSDSGEILANHTVYLIVPFIDMPLYIPVSSVPYLYTGGTWTRVSQWWVGAAGVEQANNAGQLLGWQWSWADGTRTVAWQDGLPTAAPATVTRTVELNDRGQVAVHLAPEADGPPRVGLWQVGGDATPLETPTDADATTLVPRDINERGHVVGTYRTTTGEYRLALWHDGRLSEIGTPGGDIIYTGAYDTDHLNERDQIVGTSQPAAGGEDAFLWQDGEMTDLATPGYVRSRAMAINEAGQVVGQAGPRGGSAEEHAVLWQDGEMHVLHGTLSGATRSWAYDITDDGLIFGRAAFPDGERDVIWFAPPP